MITMDKKTLFCNLTAFISILALGVMAGFFWTYSFNVAVAVENLDADTYAEVQSLFNVHVRHGMFFSFFFGAAVCSLLAGFVSFICALRTRALLQITAGLIYLLAVVVLTRQVNLPLNAETESWLIGAVPAHWQETRAAWNQANDWRTAASLLAFALSILALLAQPIRSK